MSQEPEETLYCYVHPQRETLLRCNRCLRPICTACAVRTPTGYRCKECVRSQQKVFDTAHWWDYPLTVLAAGFLGWVGSLLAGFVGFFILLIAPVAGMITAEAVRAVVRKRRSKWLPLTAALSALIGALLTSLFNLFWMILAVSQGFAEGAWMGLVSLLWPVLYALVMASTVYYRLKGIRV